jgi:hypothetical protein
MDPQHLDALLATVRHTASLLCWAAAPVTLSLDEAEALGNLLYRVADACDTLHALNAGLLSAVSRWAPQDLH